MPFENHLLLDLYQEPVDSGQPIIYVTILMPSGKVVHGMMEEEDVEAFLPYMPQSASMERKKLPHCLRMASIIPGNALSETLLFWPPRCHKSWDTYSDYLDHLKAERKRWDDIVKSGAPVVYLERLDE